MAPPVARALFGCALCVALACGPARAHAWTRANVESAAATLELEADGRARVTLALQIKVAGGWLSRFEIAGLDPSVTLDPSAPPAIVDEAGEVRMPAAKLRSDGRVVLSFAERKGAPHRGLHRLTLTYLTSLAAEDGPSGKTTTLSWSMPAWQTDLRVADIWVNAPLGTRFASESTSELDPAAVERELVPFGARTQLHLRRVQLPRTLAFSVELELPEKLQPAPIEHEVARAAPPDPQGAAAAALLVLALALLKRRAASITAARRGGRMLPWLAPRWSARARVGWMLAAAAVAALGYDRAPRFALALLALLVTLALDRGVARSASQPQAALRRALFDGAAWLDATTPLGLALLASAWTVCVLRLALGVAPGLWLECMWLVTPLFLTATRWHTPLERSSARPSPELRASSASSAISADAAALRAPDRAA